jgi:uncharacterized protein YbjT (DUF2867 family)
LNELTDVAIKHLRPGYFYSNLFASIPMIKGMNLFGSNVSKANDKIVLSDTTDIADAAAEELLNLSFTGHSVRYLVSDERTPTELVKAIGSAIGKPELPYVEFSDEDTVNGLKGAGLPEEVAKNYAELGHAMRNGKLAEDYQQNRPQASGRTKLADFSQQFAGAFSAS